MLEYTQGGLCNIAQFTPEFHTRRHRARACIQGLVAMSVMLFRRGDSPMKWCCCFISNAVWRKLFHPFSFHSIKAALRRQSGGDCPYRRQDSVRQPVRFCITIHLNKLLARVAIALRAPIKHLHSKLVLVCNLNRCPPWQCTGARSITL